MVRSVRVGGFGGCLGLMCGVYTGLVSGFFGVMFLVYFWSGCVGEARVGLGRFPSRLVGLNRGYPHARAVVVEKYAGTFQDEKKFGTVRLFYLLALWENIPLHMIARPYHIKADCIHVYVTPTTPTICLLQLAYPTISPSDTLKTPVSVSAYTHPGQLVIAPYTRFRR